MASRPLPAEQVAQREWPALRAGLLDAAAALDRIDRAGGGDSAERRLAQRLLEVLAEPGRADRAERVLTLLSREYDPSWRERFADGQGSADPPPA
ncbi:hypothetical protein [Botrimarina sp.]|uniref:hypothetical protein n=1 Tax=Botrimarina sp. TaxID=2795802 RepID=UPI0032EFD717